MDVMKRILIPLSEDDKNDIITMFRSGKGTTEISEYIGCSRSAVYYHLRKMNMTGSIKWADGLDDSVIELYKSRVTKKEISTLVGLPVDRVSHRIMYLRKIGKL